MPRRSQCKGMDLATRMLRSGVRLSRGRTLTYRSMMAAFGISLAQAKRDLVKIEQSLPIERFKIGHQLAVRMK